jgi:hypothetical protein
LLRACTDQKIKRKVMRKPNAEPCTSSKLLEGTSRFLFESFFTSPLLDCWN